MNSLHYNKYVNRVGIEFEGLYDGDFRNSLLRHYDLIRDETEDSSIENDSDNLDATEIRTQPLTAGGLNEVLGIYNKNYKADLYQINSSVGLHYHISLKKRYYGYLVNQDFYDAYVKMVKLHFPKLYQDRKGNNYCYANLLELDDSYYDDDTVKDHFQLQSENKYAFVNYQYLEHSTIEFRAYGGTYASIEGLAKCIQLTIDLIEKFIKTHEMKPVKLEFQKPNSCPLRHINKHVVISRMKNQKILYTERILGIEYFLYSRKAKELQEEYVVKIISTHFDGSHIEVTKNKVRKVVFDKLKEVITAPGLGTNVLTDVQKNMPRYYSQILDGNIFPDIQSLQNTIPPSFPVPSIRSFSSGYFPEEVQRRPERIQRTYATNSSLLDSLSDITTDVTALGNTTTTGTTRRSGGDF